MLRVVTSALAVVLLGSSPTLAQERPVAFVGARIIPVDGEEIPHGILLVQGGKIRAVGAADSTAIPADAERHDVTGKVIMPGLICTHSHIGGIGGAEGLARGSLA